jgi:hypothetical protein
MSRGFTESAAGALPGLIGASVLVSAYIHVELWFEGMARTPVVGPLFLLNALGGLVIGLAVLFWRHWLPLVGALGFGVATLAAFWISTSVGLFGLHEQMGGVAQVAAEAAEIVTVVGAAAALWIGPARDRVRADEPRARRSTPSASA